MKTGNQDNMPVFVINGFLEAGKTQFISFTLEQDYFQSDGVTVLVLCEEGDTEYDPELLKKTRTKTVTVEEADELTPEFFKKLEAVYDPDRILIEWNGMWPMDQLSLPDGFEKYQQITIIDGSTIELYLANLKSLLGLMIRESELVIMNRCDDLVTDDINRYRRNFRALNTECDVVFEDKDGEIDLEVLEEDLPYDLKADVLKLRPEDYGIWYVDSMDQGDRYNGKKIEVTGQLFTRWRNMPLPPKRFIFGREAMTCCEADIQILGFPSHYTGSIPIKNGDWVKIHAKLMYVPVGNDEMEPVLEIESLEPAKEITGYVTF